MINSIKKYLQDFADGVNGENQDKSYAVSKWINKQQEYDENSTENAKKRTPYHPIRPVRGEVFVVDFGSNVGFEFNDIHLGLVIQNDKGNMWGDTTIVLPITEYKSTERFDSNVHYKLQNTDFESVVSSGLDKDPSKVKLADITTIDKARLGRKVGKLNPTTINLIQRKLKKILETY